MRDPPRGSRFAALIFLPLMLAASGCGEKTEGAKSGDPWFEDATEAVKADFLHDSGHRTHYPIPEDVCGGCAIFDYDGDGWMDLYFVQAMPIFPRVETGKTNRLFRNRRDGTFEDATARAEVGASTFGVGCACGDYDGDGDVDLFLSNLGPDILYRNDGDGTFTDVTKDAGVTGPGFGSSAAFVDYDSDGKLDLIVAQYINWSVETEIKCTNGRGEDDYCTPANYQAPAFPVLYKNLGNGAFRDVTHDAGLGAVAGNGLGVACADFNGDGHMDLYVANDGDPNRLWINDGQGRFTDQALLNGCAVSGEGIRRAGMGVAAVDLTNSGVYDIVVTNLVGETNALYRNVGSGCFVDQAMGAGIVVPGRPFTGFGVGFRDFNHDGMLDLYVANGRVTKAEVTATNTGTDRYGEINQLFRGREGVRFEEVFPRGGTATPIVKASRAAAFGDLDNDGDVDAVVVNRDARADVLRNVAAKRGNWIMFRIVGAHGSDAIGALVRVAAGGVTRSAYVMPSYGYCSSSDPRLHFGLGSATEVTSVTVRWVGGKTETYGPFASGKLHEIRQRPGG